MTAHKAKALATILRGETWRDDHSNYSVIVNNDDGSLTVFNDTGLIHYCDDDDEYNDSEFGFAQYWILFRIPDIGETYVIVNQFGHITYQDNSGERCWTNKNEALREARILEAEGKGQHSVIERSKLPYD